MTNAKKKTTGSRAGVVQGGPSWGMLLGDSTDVPKRVTKGIPCQIPGCPRFAYKDQDGYQRKKCATCRGCNKNRKKDSLVECHQRPPGWDAHIERLAAMYAAVEAVGGPFVAHRLGLPTTKTQLPPSECYANDPDASDPADDADVEEEDAD